MRGLKSYDILTVGSDKAVEIAASPEYQAKIHRMEGGKVFYKTASDVDTGDTEIEGGTPVTVEGSVWVVSASRTRILVEHPEGATLQDATVSDKLIVNGEAELNGDLNHDGSKVGLFGVAPAVRPEVKKAALTANELATELAKLGIVKVEA
jgi:hypothetical protein